MRVISVANEKESEVVVRVVRYLFLACKDALQCVSTQVVKNCTVLELMPIIENIASKESVIFSDGFKSYDGLVDYGYKEHFRVKPSECFAVGNNHINGIENFWGLCKVRLPKFRGIKKKTVRD